MPVVCSGIVRRIDELGRIVIPKEIRHRFKINDGDPLSISVSDTGIILTPYEDEATREGLQILADLEQSHVSGMTDCERLALKALLECYIQCKRGE